VKILSPHQKTEAIFLGNEEATPWYGIAPLIRNERSSTNVGRTKCVYKTMLIRSTSPSKTITDLKECWMAEIADLISGVPPL